MPILLGFVLAIFIALPLIGFVLLLIDGEDKQVFFIMSYLAATGLLFHLLFYNDGDSGFRVTGLKSFIVETALQIPLLLWVLGVIPFVIFCIAKFLRRLNTSIFSAAPLEVIIKDLLAGGFKMPMYATVAREIHEYFDPDNLKYEYYKDTNESIATPRSTIIPSYVRVNSLSPEDALTTLLATSALPLGITPRRKGRHIPSQAELNGGWEAESFSTLFNLLTFGAKSNKSKVFLMDGGIVDNTPWYPFIEDVPCDEIVIVGCNPMPNWNDSDWKKEWKTKDRLLRVVISSLQSDNREGKGGLDKLSGTFIHATFIADEDGNVRHIGKDVSPIIASAEFGKLENIKNDPPKVICERDPDHLPERVVIIAPDTPLGNFLTGTLNFSTNVARKRLEEGYQKASRIIKEIPDLLP